MPSLRRNPENLGVRPSFFLFFANSSLSIQMIFYRIMNMATCKWTGRIKGIKKHLTECEIKWSACQFVALGCKARIMEGDLAKHNEKYIEKHTDMLEKALKE